MPNDILSLLMNARAKRTSTPLSPDASDLCRILDHQLYLRDRYAADLKAEIDKLSGIIEGLQSQFRRDGGQESPLESLP